MVCFINPVSYTALEDIYKYIHKLQNQAISIILEQNCNIIVRLYFYNLGKGLAFVQGKN